jgi:hypothetical protein
MMVTGLGKNKIILGLPWFREVNLIIDWQKGTLDWQQTEPDNETEPEIPVIVQTLTAMEETGTVNPNEEDNDPWGSFGEIEDDNDGEDEGFWMRHDMTDPVKENPKTAGGDLLSIKSLKTLVEEVPDKEERETGLFTL